MLSTTPCATSSATPIALDDDIRRKFPLAPFQPRTSGEHLDIMVAGCGTGAHPIETCRRYAGARVLALEQPEIQPFVDFIHASTRSLVR